MRVVSLVPSTTETLFALGVGDGVVGRTAFCVRPDKALAVPQVGGTKTPDIGRIAALAPDLILTNAEENRAEDMAALVRLAPVASFYPRTVQDAIADLTALGGLVGRWEQGAALARQAQAELTRVRIGATPFRYAYLIWRQPWMAAGAGTYITDFLAQAGGVNVFDSPTPYPTIEPADLFARAPDVVLLPDEPFPFRERHAAELTSLSPEPSVWQPRLRLVDGQLFSWHGVRLLDGLRMLHGIMFASPP